MSVSLLQLSASRPLQLPNFMQNPPIPREKPRCTEVTCCKHSTQETRATKNYYELLGVSVSSSSRDIKEAYRKLQKKYHPDIAGPMGHEYTLKLNEAYQVLMKEDLRREYNASTSIGNIRAGPWKSFSGLAYSSWEGPLRPEALFVDENACIGCRECVHHAPNTFAMDETLGCARVKVQYGDDHQRIEVAVESCPVNCIYWVCTEDLPVLEFLVQPQPKEGYGMFGGGWERPSDVFLAAKSFKKKLKWQARRHQKRGSEGIAVEEETPAQAEARRNASIKLKMEILTKIWTWVREISGFSR